LFVAAGFSLRQKMTECGCLSSPLQAAGHSGIFCKINQHALFLFFYIVIIFTISSMTDYLILTGIFIIAMIVFYRDAVSMLKKTVLLIAPFSIVLTVATLIYGIINNIAQLDLIISFNIRSLLITFLTFNFIRRVNLFEAFGFSKLFITIISIAMGQISTYRRLINDFYLGLKSRMLKKPSLTKTLRASSGITGSLLNLSLHHSREVADALKSRGVDY
jgi:cobalt/nickel transport system permease protein